MEVIEIIAYVLFTIVAGFLGTMLFFKLINRSCYGKEVTPDAKQDTKVKTDSLRFLQYNVKWTPNIARLGRNEFAKERAEILAQSVADYDVICLNEAYSYIGSPVVQFIKTMKKKGFTYVKRLPPTSIMSFEIVDGGVLVLSKYPILAHDTMTYELNVGYDMAVAKGVLYLRIQTGPGTHAHVFATHLQTNYPGSYLECRTVRFSQIYAFNSLRSRKATDGQPIILIGDLNVDARMPEPQTEKKTISEYNRLIKVLTTECYTLTDALFQSYGKHEVTYGADDKRLTVKEDQNSQKCLDYVLVWNRDEGQYIVAGTECNVVKFTVDGNKNFTQLSDHYGLACTVHFSLLQNDV
ncbi:Endonuclease/Exonuclease/phosphatase family protein [Tritrichomonas foetus]|uniref:sphingomyelin phosphodiesterase n=1 Tax=Tritrichomonas foetus TaxID=1144522 RepID=A0A1J4KPR2_9EUKA|nr:Endonuclease/Exonuclease/phosphatase family protein [Tritrichomonas foetus]|eukprot:OHT11780.1 Endonuclease/Exonuclease/phosphatase family protein [Tritrichomonas foetus]